MLWEVIGEFYVRELHGHIYVLKVLCWVLLKDEWSKTRIEAGSMTVWDQGRGDGSLIEVGGDREVNWAEVYFEVAIDDLLMDWV